MRIASLTLLAFVAFAAFASSAFAEDKDLVDTKRGLTFSKPSGWVVSPPAKGSVAVLYKAGDKQSRIEFRHSKMAADKTERFFHSFHRSLVGAGLEKVENGSSKKYGNLTGKLTEYKAGEGDRARALFVFEFVQEGAWIVVGMFKASERKPDLKSFEEALSNATFAD